MTFNAILQKYRQIAFSQKDKGDRFERLMQAFLQTDPKYAHLFRKVWLWNEFPARRDLGGIDTGIDLVALTHEGDYWAIQCKCYQENTILQKGDLDGFLATSGRTFTDDRARTVGFSHRLWISTTRHWGIHAEEAIHNQIPPVSRINLYDLDESPVDWEKLESGIHGQSARREKKSLLPHQKHAVETVLNYFRNTDRGKLIMACGTGKTFTSLRIAEYATNGTGTILFLVPSIALLGQALREWSADAKEPINAICICSDPEVSRQKKKQTDIDAMSVVDLALPASTDPKNILAQFIRARQKPGMTVVFSTYQSIDVIARAQTILLENRFDPFDLIICDEAHRTTGVTLAGEDETEFVKVHNADFIRADKRLYMTATPRLYSDDAKSRAAEAEAVLASMDDTSLYGDEIYRIGFGEAVEKGLLTDYKVLILTLTDRDVPAAVQKMATPDSETNVDDLTKLVGCVNALSKQLIGDDGRIREIDPEPMRRAVAFCPSISASKKITTLFNDLSSVYLRAIAPEKKDKMVAVESRHMDGTMSAPARDEGLNWVKAPTDGNACRILTNVRVLSEGVDVPSLDAVMFLSAKNSQVDVVQSVGRVMRKAPNKKYGYIVIPVVVPTDVEPERALDDNERYKVVWTVLNALRAHDDRFNATINKIELNRRKPEQICVVGIASGEHDDRPESDSAHAARDVIQRQLKLQFAQLQAVVFARLVHKVGDRRYWEQWARDVAVIAERQKERIEYLIVTHDRQKTAFADFVTGLQRNINPGITEAQAVDMLAQHIITKPIFEALFEGYSFVKHNAVSQAMQNMLQALEEKTLPQDSDKLQRFYESVRKRAAGIDNAEGKQRIIIELYDKFFKTAFPRLVEQLGIVYTPVEAVDFIIHSIEHLLRTEFGRSLSDENIHILDPFTGTGTFMVRLLQSGLIRESDLDRKYRQELHANEIVLLAYYIAAVNIENAYHDATPSDEDGMGKKYYYPFEGIVLTDTFQLSETDEGRSLFSEMLPKNSERVLRQKNAPLRVIMGNPPYSVGQRSANDNAQNQEYLCLDRKITDSYVKASNANLSKSSYDSYIRAFRWSSDRLDPEEGGVIAFISNAGWLDGNAQDGFRKTLEKEFTGIWVFNLRGNQRTSGELSRKEGGKIFGSGSRTPIAITFLVKNPAVKTGRATIHYHDIGDYLSREEKLSILRNIKDISNPELNWMQLETNEYGDWLNKRNDTFSFYSPLAPEQKFDEESQSFFVVNAVGVASSRDAWVYNFSKKELEENIRRNIQFYNQQLSDFSEYGKQGKQVSVMDFISRDHSKISWSVNLIKDFERSIEQVFRSDKIRIGSYRPFMKQHLYFNKSLIERPGINNKNFPISSGKNAVITVTGEGNLGFSVLITSLIPDYCYTKTGNGGCQAFPLYYFEEKNLEPPTLWDNSAQRDLVRRDGVTDFILERARKQYGVNVTKEDIFYYVYGFLHSPEYRTTFANDLKKSLPRLPLVDDVRDFWAFSKAGRQLADLHIGYENVPPCPELVVTGAESGFFRVEKMRFPKKGQKDTILYNSAITITSIPARAYDYVVNGKSAIEWVMERYQVTTHKESGITNDPNDWAEEVGNPRYILDLLLSIVNVSLKTIEIVEGLPRVEFE